MVSHVSTSFFSFNHLVYNYLIKKVDAGNRAVIFDKVQGIQKEVVGEGTHFKIPFLQVILSLLFE